MKRTFIAISLLFLHASMTFAAQCTEDMAKTKITNFHEVVPGVLYRGSRPEQFGDVATLKASCGVSKVLNLQGGDPWYFNPLPGVVNFEPGETLESRIEENGYSRVLFGEDEWNVMLDSFNEMTPRQEALFEKAVGDIAQAAKDKKTLYVHCEHGVDRTGLVIALYEVFYLGVSPADALNEMLSYGHSKKSVGSYCRANGKELQCVNGAMVHYFQLATAAPMSLTKLRDATRAK